MDKRYLLLTVAALGIATVGLLLGQTTSGSQGSPEWKMFSQRVAGFGGGGAGYGAFPGGPVTADVFLYNQRTGKAYRFFSNCAEQGANGCFAVLPVLEGGYTAVTPQPQSERTDPPR